MLHFDDSWCAQSREVLSEHCADAGAGACWAHPAPVGCATPVGVTQLGLFRPAIASRPKARSRQASPLNRPRWCSGDSGFFDRFEAQPETVLAELHRGLSPAGDEDRLFTLAELSFLHAQRTGDREYFLAWRCVPGRCSSRAKRQVCSFNGRIPDCGWRTISTTKASPRG